MTPITTARCGALRKNASTVRQVNAEVPDRTTVCAISPPHPGTSTTVNRRRRVGQPGCCVMTHDNSFSAGD